MSTTTTTRAAAPRSTPASPLQQWLASVRRILPLAWPVYIGQLAVLAFNLAVSLGYAAVAFWRGGVSGEYLLLVNLRVVLLVFLGFWFAARVDLLAALAGVGITAATLLVEGEEELVRLLMVVALLV